MRRDFVSQATRRTGGHCLHLPAQIVELALQHGQLLLLAKYRAIERIDEILGESKLDFEFLDTPFDAAIRSHIPTPYR